MAWPHGSLRKFFASIEIVQGGCWEWRKARVGPMGYGIFHPTNGTTFKAHRWSYKRLVEDVSSDVAIDHTCCNAGCVNPLHLEPVTVAENNRRMVQRGRARPFAKDGPRAPRDAMLGGAQGEDIQLVLDI